MSDLLCPMCLIDGIQNPAVTQVEGTVYCPNHGMAAVSMTRAGRMAGRRPVSPTPPAPPST